MSDAPCKLIELRRQGRQREHLEDLGDYTLRRALLTGDLSGSEVESFRDSTETAGYVVALRSALLAAVLLRHGGPTTISHDLERLYVLDRASPPAGEIGFRRAMGEFCDALICGEQHRLDRLHELVEAIDPHPLVDPRRVLSRVRRSTIVTDSHAMARPARGDCETVGRPSHRIPGAARRAASH